MKPLDEQTHYEALEIPPGATPYEIQEAYRQALQIYGADSVVTYSFFSPAERRVILERLERAFETLIHRESRRDYDRKLREEGLFPEDAATAPSRARIAPLFDLRHARILPASPPAEREVQKNTRSTSPAVQAILGQDAISGEDLRRLRAELGISLDWISRHTKVRLAYLERIEEDRHGELPSLIHLKGFLRAYVQCLPVEGAIVDKYLKRVKV